MSLDGLRPVIEGGLPAASVVLIHGPPGVGKSTFATQLLIEAMDRGGTGLYVTTEHPPTQLLDRSDPAPLRPFAAPAGPLSLLDAYSWRTGKPSAEPAVVAAAAAGDLSMLSIRFTEALQAARRTTQPFVIVFDTPSGLAFHQPLPALLKFLEVCFAKAKESQACLLIPLEKGVHDEPFTAALSYMCDGVLEMRFEEDDGDLSREMRVRSMRGARVSSTQWRRLHLDAQDVRIERVIEPVAGEGRSARRGAAKVA